MTIATTTPVTDHDPFGLAAIEADLGWATTGPLPSWLDGTDLSEAEALELPPTLRRAPEPELPERTEQPKSRVETLAEVGEKTEPRVDMSASASAVVPPVVPETAPAIPSENRPASVNELLDLVNLLSQCSSQIGAAPEAAASVPPTDIVTPVSEPAQLGSSHVLDSDPKGEATPATSAAPVSAAPEPAPKPSQPPVVEMPAATRPRRRVPSLVELAAARDCLIVEAGARRWAVPLHAVICLKPWPASPADIDVDLAEELGETRPQPRQSKRWMLETTELTFGVDGLCGPGTIAWNSVVDDDEPLWLLAAADHCGEPVGLIDLGHWHRAVVIPDESEAAVSEPVSEPAPANLQTMEWIPA